MQYGSDPNSIIQMNYLEIRGTGNPNEEGGVNLVAAISELIDVTNIGI